MGQPIIQPSRVRRTFNGWCHGLFAGQHFDHVLNLGCGHDHDRQGYMYSGYFDARRVTRVDINTITTYPPEEECINGGNEYPNPIDKKANAEMLLVFDANIYDMVFCNWMIYQIDWRRVLSEICRVLRPGGKLLVTYMDENQFGPIYVGMRIQFDIVSYCYLHMDQKLDGRDWIAEGIWGSKK